MALYTGNIKFTATDTEPTSDKGRIYYDDSDSQLKHYDGSDWINVNTNVNVDRPGDGQYTVDSYTKLLIHSDTFNNSTTFDDASDEDWGLDDNGGVKHSSAYSKIGDTSIAFDGVNDYLKIPATCDLLNWPSSGTIDFWVYPTDFRSGSTDYYMPPIVSKGDVYLNIGFNNSGNVVVYYYSGTTNSVVSSSTLSEDEWAHVAITWSSANGIVIYKNGTSIGSNANKTLGNMESGADGRGVQIGVTDVGSSSQTWFEGYVDELRVSEGIRRWTSNFTVY